jgi:uncharacterized YccA/Bax inhibitor family protein
MPSNNPVFRHSDGFNKPNANAYGNAVYGGNGGSYAGYGDPSTWSVGAAGAAGSAYAGTTAVSRPMTVDSVVQKTGIAVGVVALAAIITWLVTPDVANSTGFNNDGISQIYAAATIGSLGAFVLSMVNSFKRVISPALVVLFCAFEGVALGALSKVFDAAFGSGVVSGAVLGTFAAFAGTLAAYKYLNIKIGNKFRTFVTAAVFGMVGLGVISLVFSLFGTDLGLFGFGPIGALTAIVGLGLGIFMLIMDFDFVEQGIANHLDERESWRAAFAMTVSLV